jgi:acyl carrier protein
LLGLEQVGTTDSFFELGGDSILAVRLTTEIQRMLDDTVFLAAIFDAPTVRELALYLSEHHGAAVARRYGADAAPGRWEEGEL